MSILAAGHHLHPSADGAWLCSTPGDRFIRIGGPHHVVKLLQETAHTGQPVTVDSAGDDAELTRQLVALLEQRGILEPESALTPTRRTASVFVDGDTPVAEAVTELLEDAGDVTSGIADESSVSAADVVVSCASWLPDTRWTQLQQWCHAHDTAWHHCHSEGELFFVGPLWSPTSNTADYLDVRGRRLAASGVADQLVDHWRYLDNPHAVVPPVRWPGAAGIAIIAGVIAAEVRAHLDTGRGRIGSVQLEIDPAAARITHHPVLPIPFRRDATPR